jgi:hypothetical protein
MSTTKHLCRNSETSCGKRISVELARKSPSLQVHVSMSMSPCPCIHAHVSMSMSPCPCLHSHVSMSMSPDPCLYFFMSPCLHISISPFFHVSMSPYIHISILMSQSFSGILQMENGNFCLFAANGKQKWRTSICLLQMGTEKGIFRTQVRRDCPVL